MTAVALAQPNIALIKYWGKRDAELNLPASGSLSITLDSLRTRTRVEFDPALARDRFTLDGREDPAALARVRVCLDLLRLRAGVRDRARMDSRNNFPTASGLASSASGVAALVLAVQAALGLRLDRRDLSALARRGSGSAARSLFGGFVTMAPGSRADGADACASPLLPAADWPLEVVIAVTARDAKAIGSRAGMEISRGSSPFHPAWIEGCDDDLADACAAVRGRDFAALADVSERNCLKMHAVMISSVPPLLYWNGATLDCIHRVRALRERDGVAVFFTVDAGPHVVAVCTPGTAPRVRAELAGIRGVERVLSSALGEGARVLCGAEVA